MPIWNRAEPLMDALAHQVQESCSAAVLDGTDIVYVMRVATQKIMSISLGVGSRLPASCTSMGRLLLSDLAHGLHAAHGPVLVMIGEALRLREHQPELSLAQSASRA